MAKVSKGIPNNSFTKPGARQTPNLTALCMLCSNFYYTQIYALALLNQLKSQATQLEKFWLT